MSTIEGGVGPSTPQLPVEPRDVVPPSLTDEPGDFTPGGGGRPSDRNPPTDTPPPGIPFGQGGLGEVGGNIQGPFAVSTASAGGGSTGPISIQIGQQSDQAVSGGGGSVSAAVLLGVVALLVLVRK